jgi:cell division protein FtsB
MRSAETTTMATDEDELDPWQPAGKRPRRMTTLRRAIIAAAVVALLAGGAGSLATARLTDRQSDLEGQRSEITGLTSEVSRQDARIAQLTSQVGQLEAELAQPGEGTGTVDRLNAEIAASKELVATLEAEKADLEEQLAQVLNPAPGPAPTALLTASWVHRLYAGDTAAVVCIEIENTSDSVNIAYSHTQFSAVDGADFAYPPRLPAAPSGWVAFPLMDGQLGPGEKRRGQLLYDVPAQALLTRLVWNAGFGATPEITVDLPAEEFLVVDNVIPGSDANNC